MAKNVGFSVDGLGCRQFFYFQNGWKRFWTNNLVSAGLKWVAAKTLSFSMAVEWLMATTLVSAWLEWVVLKYVTFSMAGKVVDKNVGFSMAGMVSGRKRRFQHGLEWVVAKNVGFNRAETA